jgi:hypothetical protein
MTKEYRDFLKEVDKRVLPRRKDETDEEYGKRMREYLGFR